MKVFKSTAKRGVIVNGAHYNSLSDAARAIDIPLWKIHRAVNAKIKIEGVKIMYVIHTQAVKNEPEREPCSTPLLFYPAGETPFELGSMKIC
ncbi:MAG: hypothetical protein FWC21_04680 [Treponema sp.]|nr:hypothetical protein [Treponema sp.]